MRIILFLILISLTKMLKGQNFETIRDSLESGYLTSLKLRSSLNVSFKEGTLNKLQLDSMNSMISKIDSLCFTYAISIIDKYGWLGKDEIGSDANQAIFLAIQHHPKTEIRKRYYPLLEESVSKKESNKADLATMKDRILVESHEKQLFGTQYKYLDGSKYYYPIDNIDSLNKRRKKMGLKKLKISDILQLTSY